MVMFCIFTIMQLRKLSSQIFRSYLYFYTYFCLIDDTFLKWSGVKYKFAEFTAN